jgi:hypothetical protein
VRAGHTAPVGGQPGRVGVVDQLPRAEVGQRRRGDRPGDGALQQVPIARLLISDSPNSRRLSPGSTMATLFTPSGCCQQVDRGSPRPVPRRTRRWPITAARVRAGGGQHRMRAPGRCPRGRAAVRRLREPAAAAASTAEQTCPGALTGSRPTRAPPAPPKLCWVTAWRASAVASNFDRVGDMPGRMPGSGTYQAHSGSTG